MNDNAKLITLKNKIFLARERLHTLWEERGCTDADVLTIGMVLDTLCNEYERLLKK